MENYYEADERIVATTIPHFDGKRMTPQTQIRINNEGDVIRREFQRSGLELSQVAETRTQISKERVNRLIQQATQLVAMADSLPVIDDSGSREITLQHDDGTLVAILLPMGGGRKHPAKKSFDEVWRAIEAAARTNSEQDGGGNSASLRASP